MKTTGEGNKLLPTTLRLPDAFDTPRGSYSTRRTISGDYATCDGDGNWRPISFSFCRDASPDPTDRASVSTDQTLDADATYESFVEPADPIYAQQVIRKSRIYPSSLPRDNVVYEDPHMDQPLYESLKAVRQDVGSEENNADMSLGIIENTLDTTVSSHLAASDSRIDVIAREDKAPRSGADLRTPLTVETPNPGECAAEDVGSPNAISPGISIPSDGQKSLDRTPFHAIANEIAGLHGDCVDELEPEETFPVIQMLSDRYSTGNFLNKFY